MAKQKRATWFKVFIHQKTIADAVSDEVLGEGFRAALDYFDNGQLPQGISDGGKIIFSLFRPYIDESISDYNQSVANGKNGANERWHKDDRPPIDPLCNPIDPLHNPIGVNREAEADADVISPSDSVKTERKKREKKVYDHDSNPYKAAAFLADSITENIPKIHHASEDRIQSWADDFRKLNEIDRYDWETINVALVFATENEFWKTNILSGQAFRKHFDKLLGASK